jgi:hypothetical protein
MCKQNMIPFKGIIDECRRREDAPLVIEGLKANQLSVLVLSVGKAITSEKSQGSWISLLGLSNVSKIKWKDVNVNWVVQHSFVGAEIKFLIRAIRHKSSFTFESSHSIMAARNRGVLPLQQDFNSSKFDKVKHSVTHSLNNN